MPAGSFRLTESNKRTQISPRSAFALYQRSIWLRGLNHPGPNPAQDREQESGT